GSGWLEPGTVVVDCDHPSLDVTVREGVLHVGRAGEGPLPTRCEVALHADRARALVVEGTPSRATRLRVEPGASHVLSRLVAEDLDLAVEGLGRLVVKDLEAARLRVAVDRGEARFADLAA